MKQRIITGTLFAIGFILVAYFSNTLIFPAVVVLLSVIGEIEMLQCVGTLKKYYISVTAVAYSVACPLLAYSFRYGVFMAITLAFLFLMLFFMVYAHEKVKTHEVCVTFTMSVYVTVCFACLMRLRYVTTDVGSDKGLMVGQYIYLLVFIAAWVTDTFAYFTGVFLGKHKLCPKISPKKTIEGSVGGVFFCVIAFLVYGLVISGCFGLEASYPGLAVVAVVMSVVSQTGDLLASVIKRTYGIKDYGKLFPGHGGVLDRFDSVLLVSPFLLVLTEDANFLQLLFKI